MSNYPPGQVYSPPELPPYLKIVHDLKPIVGVPSDDEVIGIHGVIRMAQKAVEIPGMNDFVLLSRLSEHLFEAQMARYHIKYPAIIPQENIKYNPPTLPAHVSVQLESVIGAPSEEDVIRVHEAVHSYQQFANVPSIFDPRVHMELSQHLFDIQMARHAQRARQSHAGSTHRKDPNVNTAKVFNRTIDLAKEVNMSADTAAGTNVIESSEIKQGVHNASVHDALERSNRLAEKANQLAERSYLLIERSNQLLERSSQPMEQSNKLAERFNGLFERLTEHFERSDRLAEGLIKPMETIGDVLKTINRVLVRIQHSLVRNCKGNTISALDCLVNEKGEMPALSPFTYHTSFNWVSENSDIGVESVEPMIRSVPQPLYIPDKWLGKFLRFYGIAEELYENDTNSSLKNGQEAMARLRLRQYLSSCLG